MTQTETMSLAIFDPIRATLTELEEKDQSLVFDHTTEGGEKDLRSWVKRLRSYKGDVARAHKEVKANALAFGRQVDAIKNELTTGADKIITKRMEPLDEIEAKKRAEAEAIVEAERLAKEKAEAERQAELKRREAEVAKKEAEIKAKEDAVNADKLEAERVEREKRIAVEAAEKARNEAELKAKAKEAAKKVEIERAEAAERKRIENEEHRKHIEQQVFEDLFGILDDDILADAVLQAIKNGHVDNVAINY